MINDSWAHPNIEKIEKISYGFITATNPVTEVIK
jgi:hypothetical protein|tara:strand:- start:116 stop:217 length:102 start_codon:yes stop_codon:yes gene_type:complete